MTELPIPGGNPLDLDKGARIARISQTPEAASGLPYCYVEVTDTTGTHYVIRAYEKQADLLYEMATKIESLICNLVDLVVDRHRYS
jgi:hypothetical protein